MRGLPSLSDPERELLRVLAGLFQLSDSPLPSGRIESAQWAAVVEAAERNGLAPALYGACKSSVAGESLSPGERGRLRMAYLRANMANWMAFEELGALLDLYAGESIPVVVLKGAALATTLYPDPAWRVLSDLDLLVPVERVGRARGLVQGRGFVSAPAMTEDMEQFTFEEDFARARPPAQLDLHWHLLESGYYRARTPIQWFWERIEEVTIEGRQAKILRPDAQLLYLAAHYMLQHRGERLNWSLDLALLLKRRGLEINWPELCADANHFGLGGILRLALETVQGHWGVIAPGLAPAERGMLRSSGTGRLVEAMTMAQNSDLRFVVNGLSAPGLSGKVGVLFRLLIPRAEYMRVRYGIKDTRLLPWYYMRRLFESTFKVTRSALSTGKQFRNGSRARN